MKLHKLDPPIGGYQWELRYREGGRGSVRRKKRFVRKVDGERFIESLLRQRSLGIALAASNQTLAELAGDWFERHLLVNLGPRTQDDYTWVYDRYIAPRLGGIRLSEITVETIERFRFDLERDGVGRASVRRCLVVLQSILQAGVRWRRIPSNPAREARKPSAQRERAVVPLTPRQVEEIRARMMECGRHGDAALVSVLAYAGLRPQEALALEWRHVRTNTLLIEQKLVKGQILPGQKTGRWVRTVDLVTPLRDDLRDWMMRSGRRAGLVFPNYEANPWSVHDYRNWGRRAWREAAGPGPTVYDLRHSYASMQIRTGVSIPELAEQLGHSPQMTLGTYAHVIRELKREPKLSLERQIAKARGPWVDPDRQRTADQALQNPCKSSKPEAGLEPATYALQERCSTS